MLHLFVSSFAVSFCQVFLAKTPGAPITYFSDGEVGVGGGGGGGVGGWYDRGSDFIPKKIPT